MIGVFYNGCRCMLFMINFYGCFWFYNYFNPSFRHFYWFFWGNFVLNDAISRKRNNFFITSNFIKFFLNCGLYF